MVAECFARRMIDCDIRFFLHGPELDFLPVKVGISSTRYHVSIFMATR